MLLGGAIGSPTLEWSGFVAPDQTICWKIVAVKIAGYGTFRNKCLAEGYSTLEGDETKWVTAVYLDRPLENGRIRVHPDCRKAKIVLVYVEGSLKHFATHTYVRPTQQRRGLDV